LHLTRRAILQGATMLGGSTSLPGCSPAQAPPAAYVRPFGPLAPWNVPVADLPQHAQSASYVQRLWQSSATPSGNFNLTFDGYTYPVYAAMAAAGRFSVRVGSKSNLDRQAIPWNPAWRPASGSDGQVIVLDPATGREWDLWQVEFDGTTVYASNGNLVPGSYWTREVGFPPSRGAGIPYLAMLVRPAEIELGEIQHALSMPVRNPDGETYAAPATKLERPSDIIGVPEGMRFALRVSDAQIDQWVAAMPEQLPAATRRAAMVIARALRDYGWFVTDTAGNAHLQFEDRASAGDDWDRLGLGNQTLDGKSYPRDLLDGLLHVDRIFALAPSDQYPQHLRARDPAPTGTIG
jgi:hypothetical protein